MRFLRPTAICLTVMFLVTSAAQAAVVNPGDTAVPVGVEFPDAPTPSGDMIAQDSQDFVLNYDLTGTGFSPQGPTSFNITLNTQVWRDPATQRLSFFYEMTAPADQGATVGQEGATLVLNSFADFATDITAVRDYVATRSADGATLSLDGDPTNDGDALLPLLLIATDATEFDSNGSASGTLSTELGVIDDETQTGQGVAFSAPFDFSAIFQPVADDGGGGNGGGGNGGGGNVIPLPAGVWLGLVALAGSGVLAKARRVLRFI